MQTTAGKSCTYHSSAMTNTSSHYEAHSADSYEEAYFYEAGTYMQHLVDLVGNRLKLGDASLPCRLIDVYVLCAAVQTM